MSQDQAAVQRIQICSAQILASLPDMIRRVLVYGRKVLQFPLKFGF